jgi:alpha-tubulin suppressor-like RCC1 family protein
VNSAAVTAVIAATVAGGLVLPPAPAAAAGADALSFGENPTATVGANAVVRIDGRLTYETRCSDNGVPDFVYPATDVYVVSAAPAAGAKLEDAAGGPPNTIISTASLFIGEIIAITSPTGSLDEGTYSVVYDTCQDGAFDPLVDTVFPDVLTVKLPAVLPGASMALVDLKGAAEEEAYSWTRARTLFETIEKVKDIPDLVGCMMSPDPDCITGILLGEATGGFAFTAGVSDGFKRLLVSQARHYAAIAADPPDPQFRQVTAIMPVDAQPRGDGEDLTEAMAAGLVPLAGESALAEALLHSIERYQGAQAAGDGEWALTHARQAADLSAALAAQTEATTTALEGLREEVRTAPADVDAAYEAVRDHVYRVAMSGFTPDERRQLGNLGLSPAQVAARETTTRTAYPMPRVTRADIVAQLDELLDAHAGTRAALASSEAAFTTLAEQIDTQAAVADEVPTADAGGPYPATAGTAVQLDGGRSTTPGGTTLTAYDWDLDADGAFDDATGPTPLAQFAVAGAQLAGLRVTNDLARASVSYTSVRVAAGPGPAVPAATPDARSLVLTVGSSQEFTASSPADVAWLVDGDEAGSGASFSYGPAAADVGIHVVEARTESGSHRWDVAVVDVDGDSDGWTATSDCADEDAAVSPGAFELLGNGIDDDCDTGTPDAPPGGLVGTPWTWGANFLGAGGIGPISGNYIRPPREMTGYDDIVQVERGFRMGMIVRSDGRVLGWGNNFYGELGDGTATHRDRPVSVLGVNGSTPELTGVVEVSTGGSSPHTSALRTDGTVVSWGRNSNRQLGDGSNVEYRDYPVPVLAAGGEPLSGVRSVESGRYQTYAIMDDGTVRTWGMSHCSGGSGLVTHPTATILPSLGTSVRQISSGGDWTAFRMADGSVLSCGGNRNALGRTLTQTQGLFAPHPVNTFGPGSGVIDVSAGYESGAALKADGSVWAWGWNGNGSLTAAGVAGGAVALTPVRVPLPPGPPVVDVEIAEACHIQALRADGSILIWGCDTHGSSGIVPAGTVTTPTVLEVPAAAIATSSSVWNGLALARPVVDTAWERPAFWIEASIADAAGTEGEPGSFEVTLSESRPHDVTLDWSVVTGSAGEDDLDLAGGTVTVPAGQKSAPIPAPVVDDTLNEAEETYTVTLTGASHGLTITRSQATGTIEDDDAPPAVSVDALTIAEGDTSLTDAAVPVRLSAANTAPVTVTLTTEDGSAQAPADYASVSLRVIVPAGETEVLAHVPVQGDREIEPEESFTVRLSNPVGAVLGGATAEVTITDDEPLALSVSSPTVVEGDSGTTPATFGVTLDPPAPAGVTVTVPWSLAAGTAVLPDDIAPADGVLTFQDGTSQLTVTADVVGDGESEPTEFFRLLLGDAESSDDRMVLPADVALAAIEDDDPADVAPTVEAGDDRTGTEGAGVELAAVVTDPDSTPTLSWSAAAGTDVDDGAQCTFTPPDAATTTVTCTDNGTWTLTATADDGVNPPLSDALTLSVVNAVPVITGLDVVVGADGSRTVSVAFSDAGADTHTCTFRWGDGVTDTVPADRSPCSASHAYPVGDHTVSLSVADDDGDLDVAERSLLVYGWAGFFAPVGNPPTWNTVTAGQAIPLKLSLGGYQGTEIFADGFPASRSVPCTGTGTPGDLLPTATPGSSELSYAEGNDRYHVNWKTERSWRGTCREYVLGFADGSERTALFRFR